MNRFISRIVSPFFCLSLITGQLTASPHVQAASSIAFQSQALGVRTPFYWQTLNRRPSVVAIRDVLVRLHVVKPDPQKELADSVRAEFFIHNDGVDFATTPAIFSRTGVLDLLRYRKTARLTEILAHLHRDHARVNEGYVRVGLQLLAEQGWITISTDLIGREMRYSLTEKGRYIVHHPSLLHAYEKAADFIQTELSTVEDLEENFPFTQTPRSPPSPRSVSYEEWIQEATAPDAFRIKDEEGREGKIIQEIKTQLWGTLLGPTAAIFEYHDLFNHLPPTQKVPIRIQQALSLFVATGILQKSESEEGTHYTRTPRGKAFIELAGARGVPVSYLPMLAQLDTLYFGDASRVFELDAHGHERHVARRLNLMGTRKAHKQYFKKMIPRLAALFDNDDFENQPRFIADMGCGDGSFLIEAYKYILKNTKRGKMILEHPLWIVGADFNLKAREITYSNMQKADIKTFHVIKGDINDPAALAKELARLGHDPLAGVHTSTFLMHNRPFIKPSRPNGSGNPLAGAFVVPHSDYAQAGYFVSNGDVEQNFFEWIERWKPLVARFGMFFIELHTAPAKPGAYAATSYLATHAYSGQYLLPMTYFLELMKRAGMQLVWMLALPEQYAPNAPNGLYHYRTHQAA